MKFLILLAQYHLDFRLTELESLADFHGLNVDFSNYTDKVSF